MEILLPSFIFLGFAIGVSVLAIAYYINPVVHIGQDIATVALVSFAAFFIMRKFLRTKNDQKMANDDVNQY